MTEFLTEDILSFLHTVLSFLLIMSIIVFIHEFGHFWVARRCGVKITTFSIGFGREIWGFDDKHGTRWKFSLVPLGGYVQMFGDEGAASTPDNEALGEMSDEENKIAFHSKPLWQKFLVVAAGPAANFILAAVILCVYFISYGRPQTLPVVGEVLAESAAEVAGLQSGDIITEINGDEIELFGDVVSIVSLRPEQELELKFDRNGEIITTQIIPKSSETKSIFGDTARVGRIGIASAGQVTYKEFGVAEAMWGGVSETWVIAGQTLTALGQMITGQRSAEELSGILRIGDYSGKATSQGIAVVLWFMAVLSVNLGLINLFPIPMLDGGHLLFYIIEGARGRPMAEKVQEYAFKVGFVLLIGLMLFAIRNDIKHFGWFG